MSALTGCVCAVCHKWHSHISEWKRVKDSRGWRWNYICVNCKKKGVEKR